jgi:asparagine synthase (glutamine-hydrolysing)
MCGIAGVMSGAPRRADELAAIAERMSSCIAHRGPDDSGVWVEEQAGLALGFRRLSIIDVSAAGHQPMHSASRRFTIIFNGEVYNYVELRNELETIGARFHGHSDTEVILAAFERWGIEAAVTKFVGMFAIAVWDAQTRRLSLIRDRLGIKPVYYYAHAGVFSFASEL